MKPVFKSLLAAATVAVMSSTAVAQEPATLQDLLNTVKENRASEAKINAQREAEFQSARADKQALLRKAQSELKAEEDRGNRLQQQFSDNEVTLNEKAAELEQATGTLGEMFGVVRQASSEAYGRIATSIVSAQYPGRDEFLARMSEESKGLPNIDELEELWISLQTEMTEQGSVVKFTTDVINLDGGTNSQEVLRVGTFNLVGDEGYLTYDDENDIVQPLGRQPDGYLVSAAKDAREATSGFVPFYADP